MNRIARRMVGRKTEKGWTVRAQAGRKVVQASASTFADAVELAQQKLDAARHVRREGSVDNQKRSA